MKPDLIEFSQSIDGLPDTSGINRIVLREVVNAKVNCVASNGDARITAAKVVEAVDESAAQAIFKKIRFKAERDSGVIEMSEFRETSFAGQAYIAITVPIPQGDIDLICTALAIELDVNAALANLNCKVRAGSIVIQEAGANSSIVLDAGRVDVNAVLGGGSHFIEMKTGEVHFDQSAQKNLIWRLVTRLGEIRNEKSGEVFPSPYTGMIGSGDGRLTCDLEVGHITLVQSD